MPDYKVKREGLLDSPLYSTIFEDKGVKYLKITRSKTFDSIKDVEFRVQAVHTWSFGDTLFRLSHRYYGTYDFWWTIALINNKPTDAHFKINDTVLIISDPSKLITAVG